MKKIVILSIIFILASACYNNSESVAWGREQYSPKLSHCIEESFAYFIKHEDNPNTSTVYMMEFLVEVPGFPPSDTLICFCACNKRQLADGVKGIITIGDYRVLVIDQQDIGGGYYNVDSLVDTDLNRLCLSSSEVVTNCCVFVLDGDSYLYLLGCQPDDFVPIKIRQAPDTNGKTDI